MAFSQEIFQALLSQGVDPQTAAAQANTPDAPAAPPAPPAAPTFQAPAPQSQSQYAPNPATQAQQAQPELARGTLEDFYSQPTSSNGGKGATQFFTKGNKPVGSWLQIRVDRDITNADVTQLTDVNNVPQTWKYGPMAGKPKFQLVIPGTVLSSSDGTHAKFFENGAVRLYLKPGPVTDAFRAALQAGGENSGFPKGGSEIVMISAGEKQNKQGYNATKLYDFRYTAPNGQVTEGQFGVPAGGHVDQAAQEVASAPVTQELPPTAPAVAPVPAPPAAPPAAPAASTPSEAPAPAPVPPVTVGGETREELLARIQGMS